MFQKWIALLLSCALVLTLAAACGRNNDTGSTNGTDGNSGSNPTENLNNGNVNTPGSMTPGNEMSTDPSGSAGLQNGSNDGDYPTFPNSLATMDADVAVTDLFDTLGLTETDLDNAMRDIATVGDGENGSRTYRHRLLGEDADVSYDFDDQRAINRVTVKAKADSADEWRNELTDTLGAQQVEGDMNSWTYDKNKVKIADQGDHVLITIEKDA